jgi:hypothetical protein
MYSQLTSSIKSAYDKCCREVSVNGLKKNSSWYTKELYCLKHEMLSIRYKLSSSPEDLFELKRLKKSFKKIMKRNIFLYEKNEFF